MENQNATFELVDPDFGEPETVRFRRSPFLIRAARAAALAWRIWIEPEDHIRLRTAVKVAWGIWRSNPKDIIVREFPG